MYHAHHHAQLTVPNGLLGMFYVGDLPLPEGQTIGDQAVPENVEITQEVPMVLNDAGVIGLSLNGKSFPATSPHRRQGGRLDPDHLLQRGLADPPDAPAPVRPDRDRQGRLPADQPVRRRHAQRRARRALLGAGPARGRRAPGSGTATSSPTPKRETGMFGMVTALVVE